ncbi:MAG TPA: glycosyltransferase [Acidimicrobiia bacterium]|nr:glycosyltransferase [Acidimicrobiia bacterium]
MNPHLLYIAFWFPPSRASGVYRALATTKMFIEAGWQVTVITASTEFFEDEIGSTDETLLAEIPEGAEVIRVPFSIGLTAGTDIRALKWWSANFPAIWETARRAIRSLQSLATVRGAAPRERTLTERYAGWIDPVVTTGIKVHSRGHVDYILATGNPYSSFEAARLIAREIGAGFSVDYRDPWTIDVFTGAKIGDRASTAAEGRIMDEATFAFHVNEAIADAYRQLYPNNANKQRVVYNGFDRESIPDTSAPPSPPYRFGILGTMNDRWPMPAIFAGWKATRNHLPPGSELLLAGHLGYFAHSKEMLEARLPGQDAGFEYLGPVHKADVADFYSSIDVVVLPVPGGALVTSGKVFEALALGKPVVCVQSRGGGARTLLKDHPLAIPAEPTADSVRTALLRAAEMLRDFDPSLVERVRAESSIYERHHAMKPMLDAITGLAQPVPSP